MKLLVVVLFAVWRCAAQQSDVKFEDVIDKMEADTLELARKVEELYSNRCDAKHLSECAFANYDHCLSRYPSETCPGGDDLNVPACGDGVTCSALYSYAVSAVTLPLVVADGENKNPTDPQAIETVCFTRALDEFILEKRKRDEGFWKPLGHEPFKIYFGSQNGVFRIFPAPHYSTCNKYDPRLRPWYVAAGGGPKNILMVLDKSGSMIEKDKIGVLKLAAKRVVSTATVGDRIAIVPFDSEPLDFTDNGYMYIATQENKDLLLSRIDELQPSGGTNFYDAFETAFDILDRSIVDEVTVNCNTAILFLTDGIMTLPEDKVEQDVIDLVQTRLAAAAARLNNPVYMFTYSVSGGDPEIDVFPKQLSCSVETGVWSQITFEEEIVESLSSYYKFFALGLGTGANEGFTAWVEPYSFFSSNTVGTTVSAPVYDRSKTPHLFLGVVGIDFTLTALDAALKLEGVDSTDETFRRVIQRSTAFCPRLEISECELESYRRQGKEGDNALCSQNCTQADFVQVEEEKCPTISDYPRDLWVNKDFLNTSFTDRTCCRVGDTKPDTTCAVEEEAIAPGSSLPNDDDGGSGNFPIVGVAIGAVVAVLLLTAVAFGGGWLFHHHRQQPPSEVNTVPETAAGNENAEYKPEVLHSETLESHTGDGPAEERALPDPTGTPAASPPSTPAPSLPLPNCKDQVLSAIAVEAMPVNQGSGVEPPGSHGRSTESQSFDV